MKIAGIIPARFASTRFPGKPLIDIAGKSMIRRVYEQAKKCPSLYRVIVATDDERIREHVLAFGGEVAMTSADHQSGTDRCFEAFSNSCPDADVIINIQGDEPFIHPEQISLLTVCFENSDAQIGTLVKRISTEAELFNVNIPKVVLGSDKAALYFSRQTIPFIRGRESAYWLSTHQFYKHIGIYGYTAAALQRITALQPSLLEKAEALEQLRWLENGFKIKVEITDFESVAIDTPDDLKKLSEFL